MSQRVPAALLLGCASFAVVSACESPIQPSTTDQLRQSVEAAIRRDVETAPGGMRPVTKPPVAVEQELASRIDELNRLSPPRDEGPGSLELGPDLTGQPQREVKISLQVAVAAAVQNNLRAQQARLTPAITEAEVVAAEAAFDAVLFANTAYTDTDQPTPIPVLNGIPLGTGETSSRNWAFGTGLRKPLETGGQVSVSTDLNRTNSDSPGFDLLPDPAWVNAVRLGLTQPLLRGFGSDVNLAQVRLTRNLDRAAVQDLRQTLMQVAFDVEQTYWALVVAREDLRIRMWLVQVGEQVQSVLSRRREFDTRQAQYSDAVATVQQRKAAIVRAQRRVRELNDRLKTLVNDPAFPLEDEVLVAPADFMVESPVNIDLREGMLTAMQARPEIVKALLRIDDASIRMTVADNSRLPTLDLAASAAFFGMSDTGSDAYAELGEGDFLDWFVGANFSQPIGNRAAEATYRAARLARSSTIIGYREAVQNVTLEVKDALRDCETNYDLISATRSTRLAEAENLRTLLVEEETLAALTPEFLNLKFQRQDRLAAAQRAEYESLAAYNTSVAALYRALGTGLEMNRIEVKVE